jgi:integrase
MGNKLDYKEILSQQDCAILNRGLEGFFSQRVGTMRYDERSVRRDIQVVIQLVCLSGLPPWMWDENTFNEWGDNLAKRNLKVASQRAYKMAVRLFLKYLSVSPTEIIDLARQSLCNLEVWISNLSPIRVADQKNSYRRKPLDVESMIQVMGKMIEEKKVLGESVFRLMRDRFAFFLMYALALRPSNILSLRTDSFSIVSNGRSSVKDIMMVYIEDMSRPRSIVALDDRVRTMLMEYLAEVRPHFNCGNEGSDALFLSSRGQPLKYVTLSATPSTRTLIGDFPSFMRVNSHTS